MSEGIASSRDIKVFTNIAEQAGRLWGLSGSPKLLGVSENIVYEMNGQILRLTENHHRTANQISAELDFILALWNGGVSVARPQISINGRTVETVKEHHICIFEKADGVVKNPENTFSSLKTAHNLGRELGKAHSITASFSPEKPSRHHSQDLVYQTKGLKFISSKDQVAINEFQKAMSWVKTLPKDSNAYGLIHMDAHNANFCIDTEDHITLFDFDDCAYNFLAYDLAIPLNSLQSSRLSDTQKQEARSALLESYLEVYDLPSRWVDMIDGFMRFRRIELFAWHCMMYGVPQNEEGTIDFVAFVRLTGDLTKPFPTF